MMRYSCIISRFLDHIDSDEENPRVCGDFFIGVQSIGGSYGIYFLSPYFFEKKLNESGGFIGKNNKMSLPNLNGGLDSAQIRVDMVRKNGLNYSHRMLNPNHRLNTASV